MSQSIDTLSNVAEREIRTERIFDAPREVVFAAWTDPDLLAQWFGPAGFTTTTHEIDVVPGGTWRFTMHGPDGMDFPNKAIYTEVTPPEKLVFEHGVDGAEYTFTDLVTALFEEVDGKTKLTFTQLFNSKAERDEVAGFASEGNNQAFDRLEAILAAR
jgi:uncharacterized protein YndB with AHSA1/START domain